MFWRRLRRVPPLVGLVAIVAVLAAVRSIVPTGLFGTNSYTIHVGADGTIYGLPAVHCPTAVPTEIPVAVPEDPAAADFLMQVVSAGGGGTGCRSDGTYGQDPDVQVMGTLVQGSLPAAGATVLLATRAQTVPATVVSAHTTNPQTVMLNLTGVALADLNGAYAVASQSKNLAIVPVPTPRPGAPTAADEYVDYHGPPVPYAMQPVEDTDVEITVSLAQAPTADQQASLERAISAWDEEGVTNGFGTQFFHLPGQAPQPGYLHGLYDDPELGPRWTGATLRWLEDFGSADSDIAAKDLARRLAGWSQASGAQIVRLNFGEQGTT